MCVCSEPMPMYVVSLGYWGLRIRAPARLRQ